MRVLNFSTVTSDMNQTRVAGNFLKFLGDNPHRLGMVTEMYSKYTTTHLTESIGNIYSLDGKSSGNKWQQINSFMVEWDLKTTQIKRIPFNSVPEGDGSGGSEIIFRFPENWYQKLDTFVIEATRQQVIVLYPPTRERDNEFIVIGKLLGDDYSAVLDTSGCQPGMTTRFVTNIQPEIHEQGYVKYQSNVEKHRTFIGTHRNDVSVSARYRSMEDVFVKMAKSNKDGGKQEIVYDFKGYQQDLLESFIEARNNAITWGKTNMDVYGKPRIYDPATNQPLVAGDGILPQVERFAAKYMFSRLNVNYLNKAMYDLVSKSDDAQGNTFLFVINTPFYQEIQRVMQNYLRDWKTGGEFIWSMRAAEKGKSPMVAVGAAYETYTFAGNTIVFKQDRSLDIEFPRRKFGLMLDLTADATKNQPAVAMFTYKNGQIITNSVDGVGGSTGLSSGPVSSPIAASKNIIWGHAGSAVFNPYRSVIMMSEEINPGYI